MWVGIDDTDSPLGGCTTWVLTELLDEARASGVDLIGEPRLVRLNPNIPWKTRGNAALGAQFGVGKGPRRRIGEVGGSPVWSYSRGGALSAEVARRWIERAWNRVLSSSRAGEPGTDPALVASDRALPASMYWNAVREVVEVPTVRAALRRQRAHVRTSGSDRGIVGAAAAIAWRSAHPTWELIAYRGPGRNGQRREVNAASVRAASRRYPELFLCHDPATRRLLVAPHTPCPILYGLRGTSPSAPLAARRLVKSEPVDRWVLFRTNQGSGDHLVGRTAGELVHFRSAIIRGTVGTLPQDLPGGHVRFSMLDPVGSSLTCIAFEPTKTLPRVARALRPGDRLRVWGSRGRDPSFRLEGIELLHLSPRWGPARGPRCSTCRRPTHSMGHQRGYRCSQCHRRWPPEAAVASRLEAGIETGVYHPTPSARRHLAPRAPEG
jgi:tRNA(Ile2)-agmatinylcytidine synthase